MSTILTVLTVITASFSLLAPPKLDQPQTSGGGLLVSPAELALALKEPSTVVLFVTNNPADFDAGHIPGARLVRYDQITVDGDGLGSELPPVEQLRAVLAAVGVSDRSKVVVYGAAIPATRLFFTLDYLGHPSVRVLNGGLNAWKANGGAIETGAAARVTSARLTPRPRPDAVATADWITARLAPPKITLLDARPDAEFTGDDGGMGGTHVVGHLPDARQLVWNTLLDSSGRFLPDAELQKEFAAIGATRGTPVVSYCMVGMRASVTYFVARHLGYDSRLYDGSIIDWTRRKLPAKTGR